MGLAKKKYWYEEQKRWPKKTVYSLMKSTKIGSIDDAFSKKAF